MTTEQTAKTLLHKDGPGWSPDYGYYWAKDDIIYWEDGDTTKMEPGLLIRFWPGKTREGNAENYSEWSSEKRARIWKETLEKYEKREAEELEEFNKLKSEYGPIIDALTSTQIEAVLWWNSQEGLRFPHLSQW